MKIIDSSYLVNIVRPIAQKKEKELNDKYLEEKGEFPIAHSDGKVGPAQAHKIEVNNDGNSVEVIKYKFVGYDMGGPALENVYSEGGDLLKVGFWENGKGIYVLNVQGSSDLAEEIYNGIRRKKSLGDMDQLGKIVEEELGKVKIGNPYKEWVKSGRDFEERIFDYYRIGYNKSLFFLEVKYIQDYRKLRVYVSEELKKETKKFAKRMEKRYKPVVFVGGGE